MPFSLPDWARAHGGPVFAGALRSTPEDFEVREILDVDFSGDGEHDWLYVEKRGSNTEWIARQLARHAGIRPADVGYAGLKDRHAVTAQWFSVRRPSADGTDWASWSADDARVLEQARHQRKLRRGAHAGNRFRITVRHDAGDDARAAAEARVARIREAGVPNYFGEQRFGREAGNVGLALDVLGGKRVKRFELGIAMSAGRSYLFNAILDARVRAGTWDTLVAGERVNLDGSGSVFDVDEVTAELAARCAALDIHPTATLWGADAPLSAADAGDFESLTVRDFDATTAELATGFAASRTSADSRATRLIVADLEMDWTADAAVFGFRLGKGGFATTVLRELVSAPAQPRVVASDP